MKELINLCQGKKPIIAFLLIVFLFLSVFYPSIATSFIQTWNLVDPGYHLDYDGNSGFMSNVTSGATAWNNYKSGVLRPDTIFTIQDVYISDVIDSAIN